MRLNKKSFWKSLYKISVVLFLIGYNFAPPVLAIEQLSNINNEETPDQSVLVTTEEDSDVLNEVPIDNEGDILPEGISDPEGIAKGVETVSKVMSRGITKASTSSTGAYTISSTSGIWTSASPNNAASGINTSEIKWGTGLWQHDYKQSGLKFTSAGTQNFDPNVKFLIGQLTHMNWPVSGTTASSATLKVTLNFSNPTITPNPTFSYTFNIDETSNTTWLSSCDGYGTDEQISNTPCDDVITFPNGGYGQEVITIGDMIYTLKIDGFQNAYPTGTPVSKFVTEEKKDNTAYLVGQLSSVLVEKPEIRITKKVQYEGVDYDANTTTGPIIGVEETVNFTYIVQNTGNVELRNINVTDNKGVAVTCPYTVLESGTSMTCTGSSTAVEGQYENIGTVTGTTPTDATVTANDPAHYFGVGRTNICHYNSEYSYTQTSIKETADADGHDVHSNDIIPSYGNQGEPNFYGGKNWDAYGQSIYNNNCAVPQGTLKVNKIVTPSDDTTEFAITGSGIPTVTGAPTFFNGNTGSISGTKAVTFEVSPGTYSVTETVPDGWKQVSNTCSGIVIAKGENKECTITNTKLATLTIVKNALPSSTQEFSFTTVGTGLSNFTLTDNDDSTNPSKVFNNLQAGTYTVSENSVDGWEKTNVVCTDNKNINNIVLDPGDNVTCTFTNTKYGKISGYKWNDADNSDTTTNDRTPVSGWTIFIDKDGDGQFDEGEPSAITNSAGYYEFINLLPGNYDIYESMQVGWIVLIGGKKTVTLSAGGNIENVNFVNVKQGSITVKKNVDGNGDGDLLDDVDTIGSTGWKWTLNDAEHTTGDTVSSLNPGTYTIEEVNQDNYHFKTLVCTGGSAVGIVGDTATINLKSGEDVVCTYTNARNLGTLIVKKVVVNDNGGTLKPEDFNFTIDGGNSIRFESDGDNTFTKYAGLSYNIVEVEANQRGYTTTYNDCANVVVPHNGTATCTITNNDSMASLQLVKEVVNNNGGTANPTDWTLSADGPTPLTGVSGVTSGTDFEVGTYTLSESGGPAGYSPSKWGCTNNIAVNENNEITLVLGQSTVCTIINDDIAPKLTLTKVITETNGGTAQPDDFNLAVGGTSVSSGVANEYLANTPYAITEKTDLLGYEFVEITGNAKCPSVLGETITLAAGDDITCTITNKDLPAQLTVIKNVINAGNDGIKSAYHFTMNVAGTNVSSSSFPGSETGVTVTLDQGTFKVTEVEDTENYTAKYEGCEGTINVGEEKTCIITNTGIDHLPEIEVTKEASKWQIKETGEEVEFTFTVKNTSKVDTVEITSLTDSVFGTLDGDADCKVGTVLAVGGTCQFSITKWIEGDYSGPDHYNKFTAIVEDEEGNSTDDDDDETIDFSNVLPSIEVTKTPSVSIVPETGANVTFTFTVKNTSSKESVTITSLTDSVFETLAGDADCQVGTVLGSGASCEFDITRWIEGDYSGSDHVNVFTAKAKDNDNTEVEDTDDATVDFSNVAPSIEVTKTPSVSIVPETGANVTFTFTVKNTSVKESVTITSLTDSVFMTLAGDADCQVGTVLTAGATCEFSITEWIEGDFSGSDHVNVFTAKAKDNDNTEVEDTDDATVDFSNVAPSIEVTKTPSVSIVPETGANVTFTFTVKNTSVKESVTITSLTDSVFETLAGDADCQVGTVLGSGASCEFDITRWIEGDYSGSDHVNVFTAKAVDNDNTEVEEDDDATVDFSDVKPDITVTKTAGVTEIPETGGKVTFTFTVTNNSEEAGTITLLEDNKFGTLDGDLDCQVGTVLAGKAYCDFTAEFDIPANKPGDPNAPTTHTNTFTATVKDDDGNSDTDEDDEVITLTPVPSLKLVKEVIHRYNSDESITAADWILYASGDQEFIYQGDTNEFIFVKAGAEYFLYEEGDYMSQFEAGEWICDGGTLNGSTLILSAEDDVTCTITNTAKPATIIVSKDVISGNNDIYSEDTFEVNLLSGETTAGVGEIRDSENNPLKAEFISLNAGRYSVEEINVPLGYISQGCYPIKPVCPYSTRAAWDGTYVGNGETLEFVCTNDVIEPHLQIEKSNNKQHIDQHAGDEVTYTITVTAPEREGEGQYLVKNVKVSDIAPAGFAYLSGTWTAQKNGSDITVSEPAYDGTNPAIWAIGEMKEGDVIILTYRTKISLLQNPGTYPDIAWVKGDSLADEAVLGVSATDSTTPFVGTDVTVIEPIETEEGEVLGATTTLELPRTGASAYLTLGALLMMILGTLTLLFKPFKKFKYLFLASLMAISFVTLITPKGAMAADDDIKVSIMQPASPTNKTSFNIGFVALDLQNKPITVECYKDSETTPFATFTASAGNCPAQVSASGTYTYYVKAKSDSGEQTSNPVTVVVNLEKPSPVIDYSKAGNTLKFKTPNDGKIVRVEIHRSEKPSYTANESTKIGEIKDATPNTKYTWVDEKAEAGKTYYYALRTVDAQGNISTFVSDPEVVPVVPTTTGSVDSTTSPSAGQAEESEVKGEVAGEEDTVTNGDTNEEDKEDEKEGEEEVKEGAKTFLEKWYIWLPIILVIGGIIFYVRKQRKD